MAEEDQDVLQEELPSADPSAETQEQPETEETPKGPEEPVDDKGVSLRNRAAEASRKARKAERDLLSGQERPGQGTDPDEAIRIVQGIAKEMVSKSLEPILARQFLMEHPDAADMVDDINRIRSEYPELSGVDRLETAYKVAKADRMDEVLRRQAESESRETEEVRAKASRASADGAGRPKSPPDTLDQRIGSATSLRELAELEAAIRG